MYIIVHTNNDIYVWFIKNMFIKYKIYKIIYDLLLGHHKYDKLYINQIKVEIVKYLLIPLKMMF